MSSTETERSRRLAGELFAEAVVAIAARRRAAGVADSFPAGFDPGRESYFEAPPAAVMQPADFEFPGGGSGAGLVAALAAHWAAAGERDLAALAPQLEKIVAALAEEAAAGDGSISVLCYTMF